MRLLISLPLLGVEDIVDVELKRTKEKKKEEKKNEEDNENDRFVKETLFCCDLFCVLYAR